jgi:hypothetical protein
MNVKQEAKFMKQFAGAKVAPETQKPFLIPSVEDIEKFNREAVIFKRGDPYMTRDEVLSKVRDMERKELISQRSLESSREAKTIPLGVSGSAQSLVREMHRPKRGLSSVGEFINAPSRASTNPGIKRPKLHRKAVQDLYKDPIGHHRKSGKILT